MKWEYFRFCEREYYCGFGNGSHIATNIVRDGYELSDVPKQCKDFNELKKYFYETMELLDYYGKEGWELVSVVYSLEIQSLYQSAYLDNHISMFYLKKPHVEKEEKSEG